MDGQIGCRVHTVFDGYAGWRYQGRTYRLACGAVTVQAPNGDLLCGWMTGSDTEPADDHIYVYARSADAGKTWSEPQVLVDAGDGNAAACLYVVGGRLFALCARWNGRYTVWKWTRRESRDNGHTWTDELPITLLEGDGLSSSFGDLIRTSSGELLGSGTFFRRRAVPLTAGVERLIYAKSEEEAAAMAPIRPGETPPTDLDEYSYGAFCFGAAEDLSRFTPYGRVADRPLGLLEETLIELRDGRLSMLMRAEWGGFLWRSDSRDGGRTWCAAYPTDIPNPSSLARLIRLPDGRIALFHNPTGGVPGQRGSRDRLAVWLSEDEMQSWSVRKDLIVGGYLSYPSPLILHDGTLAFSFDRDRRKAEYVEVDRQSD